MTKNQKERALKFSAFITEIAQAMYRHNVTDMCCIFGLNGEIRNTYIPLDEKTGEKELYCNVSDSIDTMLKINRATVCGKKHTGTLTINAD